jgi:ABC-type transport system substrate-binding protein
LTAAGHGDGAISFKLLQATTSTASAYYDYSIRSADQLKSVWPAMKADLDVPPDGATFATRQVKGDFDVIAYVNFAYPSAVIEMLAQWSTDGGRNYGKFSDPKVDSMLAAAFAEMDTKKRSTILRDIQTYMLGDAVPAIGISQPLIVAYSRNRVKNMRGIGGRVDGGTYDYCRHTEQMWVS